MIYKSKPLDFQNKFDVVGCFCLQDSKLLILHRQDSKPQGNTWGIPAGKIEKDESPIDAMARELKEEVGVTVSNETLMYLKTVYIRYPEYDFTFIMYQTKLPAHEIIHINSGEHKAHLFVDPHNLPKLAYMEDLRECITNYY